MPFLEFCCRSGGSNLNAGTRTGNSTEPGTAAFKTYVSGTWVQATRTFTPAGGANPTADGIAVGDFVSIYPDAATVSPYIARITTVGATTFVTSATISIGTAPVDGALVTSASIGGAWKGPNGAEAFPLNIFSEALVVTNNPRLNMKNDAAYSISAAITNSQTGWVLQGYTTSFGDGGRANIDGGGNNITPLYTASGANCIIRNMIFSNVTVAAGTGTGLRIAASRISVVGCVVHDVRGIGYLSDVASQFVECEAYNCNLSNTAATAGFKCADAGCIYIRCIAHDNGASGTNSPGFNATLAPVSWINCISDTNFGPGFSVNAVGSNLLSGCNAYANNSDGLVFTNATTNIYIENCNFVSNAGYGINGGSSRPVCVQYNNGYYNNTSGTTTFGATALQDDSGDVANYGAEPWSAASTGDFRITLTAAKGAGRGTYTETATSYTGTIGYPDIGSAQHLESGSSGGFPVLGGPFT